MSASLSLHLLGIIMWAGGLMVLTRIMELLIHPSVELALMSAKIKRTYFGFIVGGAVLSLLTGLFQLFYRGLGYYLSQGWFHSKITLVVVMIVWTVMVGLIVARAARGIRPTKGRLIFIHGGVSLTTLVIIGLTLFGRN